MSKELKLVLFSILILIVSVVGSVYLEVKYKMKIMTFKKKC